MSRLTVRSDSQRPVIQADDLPLEEALYRQAKKMIEDYLQPDAIAVRKFLNRDGYKFPEFRSYLRNYALSTNVKTIRRILLSRLPNKFSEAEAHDHALIYFHMTYAEVSQSVLHDLDLPTPAGVQQYARRIAKLFAIGVSGGLPA